ncbi:aldolase, partial [Streptomyces sp. NPDC058427]
MTTSRLNKVIGALDAGQHVFATFSAADPTSAVELSNSDYDAVVFEMEHKPWD